MLNIGTQLFYYYSPLYEPLNLLSITVNITQTFCSVKLFPFQSYVEGINWLFILYDNIFQCIPKATESTENVIFYPVYPTRVLTYTIHYGAF